MELHAFSLTQLLTTLLWPQTEVLNLNPYQV